MSLSASGDIIEEVKYDLRTLFPNLESFAPDDGDDDGDDDDGDDNDGDEGGKSTNDADGSGDDDGDIKDPEKKRLSDEAAKWRKKFRDTNTALGELQEWKKEQERKDQDDSERLTGELEEVREERDHFRQGYEEVSKRMHITTAAIDNNVSDVDYLEHLLSKEGIELNEDGEIDDLDERVKKLIKKKPNLVAASGSDSEDEDDDEDDDVDTSRSGSPMNGRKDKKGKADFKKLAKKYPALAR